MEGWERHLEVFMNTLIGSLPRHHYVWVDSRLTHSKPCGFVPAVWFGLVSYPGRVWGCNVVLESGAIYRNLPLHGLAWRQLTDKDVAAEKRKYGGWSPFHCQFWNCYGYQFTLLEYEYLVGLKCMVKIKERLSPCPVEVGTLWEETGSYLFTAAPVGDGFSAYPEQAKEFVFIQVDNGRFTVQPTDRVVFVDHSFTRFKGFNLGLKRQDKTYTCE